MSDYTEVLEIVPLSDTEVKIYTMRVRPSGARNVINVVKVSLLTLNHTHVEIDPVEGHGYSIHTANRNL